MFERGDAHAAQRSDSDCCGCHEHTRLRNAERENTVHGDQSESQATRATNQRRTASSKRQARPTSRGTVMGMANAQVKSAAESGPIAKRRRSVSGSVDAPPVRPSANGCQGSPLLRSSIDNGSVSSAPTSAAPTVAATSRATPVGLIVTSAPATRPVATKTVTTATTGRRCPPDRRRHRLRPMRRRAPGPGLRSTEREHWPGPRGAPAAPTERLRRRRGAPRRPGNRRPRQRECGIGNERCDLGPTTTRDRKNPPGADQPDEHRAKHPQCADEPREPPRTAARIPRRPRPVGVEPTEPRSRWRQLDHQVSTSSPLDSGNATKSPTAGTPPPMSDREPKTIRPRTSAHVSTENWVVPVRIAVMNSSPNAWSRRPIWPRTKR